MIFLCLGGLFDLDASKKRLEELSSLCEDPELWNDNLRATKLLQEKTQLENSINSYNEINAQLSDNVELIELAESENDEETIAECEKQLEELAAIMKVKTTECLFSGEADSNDCFLEIHAGAGGTESQDWADMLLRMYMRWASLHKFKTQIIDENVGEEAGYKSVTIKISGHNSYGWAKTESGVHRLVRDIAI